jgi:hypothetical protein
MAAFHYYINRVTALPFTEQAKQKEWKFILNLANNNVFPNHIIHTIRKKYETNTQQIEHQTTTIQQKKWTTFTYHSQAIRKITNLLKNGSKNSTKNRTSNKIFQQLTEKPEDNNPSGIYQIKCTTCSKVYVGQSGRSIAIRHREHLRYIRTNNPKSAYALHILNNRHEYGSTENTMQMLKPCRKGTRMNTWENFYIEQFHGQNKLVTEQQVNEINPLFEMAITLPTSPIHRKTIVAHNQRSQTQHTTR